MMREYILRTHDPADVHTFILSHEELMEETYGIMVYQGRRDQSSASFSPAFLSEADVLRRGMSGKFRSREEFAKIRDKFFFPAKTAVTGIHHHRGVATN